MISKFSVKKPYTVLVGIILVIVLGVVSLTRMTTDLLPDMNLPYAVVVTTDVGASPEEVESDITAPIEAAMATTSNIKNVSSVSYDNYSMVILEYEQSTNMDSVLIEMQQELDQLEGAFPDSAGTPIIMQIDPDMMPIMIASVDIEDMDQSELSDYVENELVPTLESVEGVASVTATGTLEESIQVTMDQEKIDALNEKIQEKIAEQFAEAQEELDEASDKIESGKNKLESGKKQLSDSVSEANKEITNNQLELYKNEAELDTGLSSLKQTKSMLEEVIPALQNLYNEYQEAQKNTQTMLEGAAGELAQQETQTPQNGQQSGQMPQDVMQQMQAALEQALQSQVTQQMMQQAGVYASTFEELPGLISTLSEKLVEVNTGIATMDEAKTQIATGKSALDDAMLALSKTQTASIIEMSNGYADLAIAASQVEQGQSQLDAAKEEAESSADLNHILTVDTLNNLLLAQNFAMPAGYVGEGEDQCLVRVGDEIDTIEDLKDVVLMDLGLDGIEPILLSDVANVEVVNNATDSYSKVNGNPAVMLSIEKQTGYSTGDVTGTLLDKFDSLEKENESLRMSVLMNQGIYIDIIVQSVMENMIVGALLAVFILILFLKDIKPTLIIAFSIPMSVIFAVVLMYFTDISLNIISLSGLALGIGMLVDNSIVVIENIYRLRSEGYSVRKAAVEGAGQMTGAIIGSTLTTVCVFAPIIFTEGITRQLFVDIALTIAFTLSASLIVALTFVPMMGSIVLKKTKEVKHGFFDRIKEGYGKFLQKALKWKPVIFLLVIVLLVISVKAAFSRGFSFMDMDMETNQLSVTVEPKDGEYLSDEELMDLSDEIVEKILTIDGIETVGAMMGGSSLSMMGGSSGSVSLYLILDETSEVTTSQITEQIDTLTKDMECQVTVDNSSSDMSSMLGSGITVQIKGRDLDKLQEIAVDVAKVVENTEGTLKVDDGLDDTTASFTISVDKEKAAEYGMTVAQVFQLVYAEMASSTSATTISTDLKDYKVYVQSEEQKEVTLNAIKNLSFTYTDRSGEETKVWLSEIADFVEGKALNAISRDSQTRYINVSASIDEEHNVSLVSREIQKELEKLDIPEGYEVEMTGEDEMINEAMEQLYLMLLLAVVFIYLIMVAQFQSLLSPFIIMFTIPLAFTGGFFALYFTGNEVSVISMIGFIMLAGIIVNNGIVMVDYINQLRRGGMEKKEAIVEAGKTRLRPILMTALTTIISMSTMALGLGSGSEMMQPLAIVAVGGLIYGTLLTLIVVPCIYDAFNRNKSMVEEEL